MKKLLVRIICCFVPGKQNRHRIRSRFEDKTKEKDNTIEEIRENVRLLSQRMDSLEQFMKTAMDIQAVPQAHGNMELVQKSAVSILAKFAEVANKHKIKFWLDSGTLIGFVRHSGGFVPWDDDIDICVPRKDYEKLPALLDAEFCKNGFFYRVGEITRLYYKTLHVWVDIFPFDTGYSESVPTGQEYDDFIAKLNDIKSEMSFDYNKWLKHESPVSKQYLETCFIRRDKELVKKVSPKGFLFYGVETGVRDRTLYQNDIIYPLKKVAFFGIKAFIPNNYDKYLFLMYGDYMNWPKNFSSVHGISLADTMDVDSYDMCQELIRKYYPKKAR